MTLLEELTYRGFVNQTTFKDPEVLNGEPINFYFGVDPSADSMQIGNLAAAMMVRHFINHGHKATLLVGGATGLIGDPDGKSEAREQKSVDLVAHNKAGIVAQYKTVFAGQAFDVVDNYDWFKGMGFIEFLRDIGHYVPMRQMLGREFVQSRLGENGTGIAYDEFSYSLIQGYDFLHLYREKGVTLQLCGADQWGNSIAGVELIRRAAGGEAHIWSAPLIVNKTTGVKFGKSEGGAVWLDPAKTTPTQFYQFWINCDDAGVEDYLKIYTLLTKEEITAIMAQHAENPGVRLAQTTLAQAVTTLVHGAEHTVAAQKVTEVLTGKLALAEAGDVLATLRGEIPSVTTTADGSIIQALADAGLASSTSEARRLLSGNAIAINGVKSTRENFEVSDFTDGVALLRRGKAFKDSALIEIAKIGE